MTGTRSTSRTRKRNERERRRDDDRGAQRDRLGRGVEQRLLDLQPAGQVRRGGRAGRDEAAEVDDAPHARARAPPRRSAPRRSRSRVGEAAGAVERRLHRVDEEVGDLDAVERLVEARRPRRRRRGRPPATPGAVTRAGSRAKARTAWPPRAQAGDERGADGAAGSGDEHLHEQTRLRPARRASAHYPGRRGALRPRRSSAAGIVGLASARELLARRPGLRVAVVEPPARSATGPDRPQLRRHPRRDLLQARIAQGAAVRRGRRKLYDYCEQRGIAVERCGKVIVALDEGELGRLDELERRGRANARAGPAPPRRGGDRRARAPLRGHRRRCTRPRPASSTSARWRARWPTTCAAPAASSSSGAR